ncbi:hypothetical protein [Salinisphaera sp. Q1T1-3]|uniref:hypothetical protein n=1 Tax=Salinisphaera sp. Q1T1-3 TaxID=2321229 RepID=UPI000E70DA6A|nr:hypothetical protein [Salinisphaera sp. Q1T1-3]RJS94700.1 hypothetical protein D3260_02685 [Salinisphaera sp. Q1T1-3]
MTDARAATRLRVYVFSYNRPDFLENIVRSVTTLIPEATLTIIDDDSEDRKTRRLLAGYADRYAIMRPSTHASDQTYKTGGLYANKTLALEDAIAHDADYMLYMHDDQQIVRAVDVQDMDRFDTFFAANPDVLELQPCFFKHDLREADAHYTRLDASGMAYFRDNENARGHKHFAGSGLFHVARTKQTIGVFGLGEKINEAFLAERGIYMGFYAWPFMAWLPFPISYRGKKRSLAHRAMEWLGGGGFHPIDTVEGDKRERLMTRDLAERPVAEDWLIAPTAPKAEKWSTMGGFYNASARRGFRKALARLIWKQVNKANRRERTG